MTVIRTPFWATDPAVHDHSPYNEGWADGRADMRRELVEEQQFARRAKRHEAAVWFLGGVVFGLAMLGVAVVALRFAAKVAA